MKCNIETNNSFETNLVPPPKPFTLPLILSVCDNHGLLYFPGQPPTGDCSGNSPVGHPSGEAGQVAEGTTKAAKGATAEAAVEAAVEVTMEATMEATISAQATGK